MAACPREALGHLAVGSRQPHTPESSGPLRAPQCLHPWPMLLRSDEQLKTLACHYSDDV
ncbi:MAG TPA: hypothetical protein VGQ59_21560 [Cyclobacteriaceae bacterium]|nr:hypothetical protein [Cyclobacteriaceae bacterium]